MKALEANPKYSHLPDTWIDNENIPTNIKQVENRLKSISARHNSKTLSLQTEPASGVQSSTSRDQRPKGRGRWRGRGRGRGRGRQNPYNWNNTNWYNAPPYPPPPPHLPYAAYNPFTPYQAFVQHQRNQGSNNRRRRQTKTEANQAQADPLHVDEEASLQALESHLHSHEHGRFALDSGAHPTHVPMPTPQMKALKIPIPTQTATDNHTRATHCGPIQITTNRNTTFKIHAIANPSIRRSLLSVNQLACKWGYVLFTPTKALIINAMRHGPSIIGTATFEDGLYLLDKPKSPTSTSFAARTVSLPPKQHKRIHTTIQTTHQPIIVTTTRKSRPSFAPPSTFMSPPQLPQLHNPGHPKPSTNNPTTTDYHNQHLIYNHSRPITLHRMAKLGINPSLPTSLTSSPPPITCSSCVAAKKQKQPHPRTTHQYQLAVSMSSDICGPISPTSRQGNKYFITFIDTFSRYLIVDYLSSRKNLSDRVSKILHFVRSATGRTPQILRTDNAKEYLSDNSNQVYISFSVSHSTSLPYTPQQNGIAERVNHTLVSAARASLHHSKLPLEHWEDAMRDAVYKYNRIIHSATNKLPYTMWFGHRPPPTQLFAFGQLGSIPHITDKTKMPKLGLRGHPARYLYALDDSIITIMNLHTRKPQRIRRIDFKPYYRQRDPTANTTAVFKAFTPHRTPATIDHTSLPPKHHGQARKYPDASRWAEAHDEELESLDNNHVIKWIPDDELPPNAKLIPLTMTYRYKRNSEGNIERRKARCALRGDKMLPHIHYDPERTTTYMADKATVRLIFAISAAYSLRLEHWDIESAYLHEKANTNPPVFVKQHPRFDGTFKHPCSGGLLTGNLYGGKEAGHIYLEAASKYLISLQFRQSSADPCLFHRLSEHGLILLTINIDDFAVAATTSKLLDSFYKELSRKYKVKRMGFPSTFLGWTVTQLPNGNIHISQPTAIKAIIAKQKLSNCNGKSTPYLDKNSLHPANNSDVPAPETRDRYQQLIGDLRYIADSTRPDIFYAINRLAASASETHHPSLVSPQTPLAISKTNSKPWNLLLPPTPQSPWTNTTLQYRNI